MLDFFQKLFGFGVSAPLGADKAGGSWAIKIGFELFQVRDIGAHVAIEEVLRLRVVVALDLFQLVDGVADLLRASVLGEVAAGAGSECVDD